MNVVLSVPYSSSKINNNQPLAHGITNCMIILHSDIQRCNDLHQNSLSYLITRGFLKESKMYRKQYCCGHWTRERCMMDKVKNRCDRDTFEKILNDKNPFSNDVDTRNTNINCQGYERDSIHCGGAGSSLTPDMIVVMLTLASSILLFILYF